MWKVLKYIYELNNINLIGALSNDICETGESLRECLCGTARRTPHSEKPGTKLRGYSRKVNIKFHLLQLIPPPPCPDERKTCVYSVRAINAGSLIKHENDARIIN